MPSDETRRLLRTFGVAVTQFEDAVSSGAPANEIKQAEDEARARLQRNRSFAPAADKQPKNAERSKLNLTWS